MEIGAPERDAGKIRSSCNFGVSLELEVAAEL